MKKEIALLIATLTAANVGFAQEIEPEDRPERPEMNGIEKQYVKIDDLLDKHEAAELAKEAYELAPDNVALRDEYESLADDLLSDRKEAYLRQRYEILEVQREFRDALREAIKGEAGEVRGRAIREARANSVAALREIKRGRRDEVEDAHDEIEEAHEESHELREHAEDLREEAEEVREEAEELREETEDLRDEVEDLREEVKDLKEQAEELREQARERRRGARD